MDKSRWLDDEIDFLRKNYSKIPAAKIAQILGRTYSAIIHKAQRLGLRTRAGLEARRKLNAEINDLIRLHFEEGLSYKEIGKIYGVCPSVIYKVFKSHGIKGKRWRYKAPPKEELLDFLKTHTIEETARHYKVARNVVERWLKQYGISLPRGRKIHGEVDHDRLCIEALKQFEKQGFRCIPLIGLRPDGIIIKGENVKVYAFEFETGYKPIDITKYDGVHPFDDIIWVVNANNPRSLDINRVKGTKKYLWQNAKMIPSEGVKS
jgi:transposase-like protein